MYLAVCEHAYTLAQSLDPNSEGRGVFQFKTGLMSVIRKRKIPDLDPKWSKDELAHFYEAYHQHGKDWKKVLEAKFQVKIYNSQEIPQHSLTHFVHADGDSSFLWICC